MAFMGGGGGGYCELQVPTDKVKFLVGKARATAKAIEAEYGVKLHIPRPEQQQPGGVTTVGLEAATAEGGAAAQSCVALRASTLLQPHSAATWLLVAANWLPVDVALSPPNETLAVQPDSLNTCGIGFPHLRCRIPSATSG